jgi:hypothetical protein
MKIILPLLLLATSLSHAQNISISSLPLNNKQSILNDRAFFMFPEKAANIGRNANLMAADPNRNAETRIVFDTAGMRMVFFAQEIFSYSHEPLLTVAAKDDRDDFKSRLLNNSDSLVSVLSTPLRFDTAQSAIIVNSLLVKTADDKLFRISAYITSASFNYKDQFQKLSERIFSTLEKGSRKLDTKARTETWPVYGDAKKLDVKLPEGYIITKDAKYDFEVLKFHKVTDISDTNMVSLIVYIGHHPSFFYPEQGFTASDAAKIKGTFLGKKTEWLYFKNAGQRLYIKEQQIPTNKLGEGVIIHVAMISNLPEAIEELTGIIESIKFD